MSLEGKTVLIAGGTRNLGKAIAIEFASKYKTNLFLHYHTTTGDEETFANELRSRYGVKVELYQSELIHQECVAQLFVICKYKFGSIDIAINNISKLLKKPLVEVTESEFDEINLLNKVAFFFLAEAATHLNKDGHIISLILSLFSTQIPFYSVCQGNKSAVEYYSKAASMELVCKGINVNCIATWPFEIPRYCHCQEQKGVECPNMCTKENRLIKYEDVAPIVTFLCTGGRCITGQTIYASGDMNHG